MIDISPADGRDRPGVPADALLDLLLQTGQLLRGELEAIPVAGFNEARYRILRRLGDDPREGCSQAELAESLAQSESNISTMVDRLEADGLLNRVPSLRDRRKRLLQVTPRGSALIEEVAGWRERLAARTLRRLSDDDRLALADLLRSIQTALRTSPPGQAHARVPAPRPSVRSVARETESSPCAR